MSDLWTLEEAAALLDPPMNLTDLRALIRLAGLQPAAHRRTGRPGRPAPAYDAAAILHAHATIAPLLILRESAGDSPNSVI